jgi:hypothetical protein
MHTYDCGLSQEITSGIVCLQAIILLTLPQADTGLSICSAVSPSFSTFCSASALPQLQFLHAFFVAPTSQSPTGETTAANHFSIYKPK